MKKKEKRKKWLFGAAGIIGFLLIWEAVVRLGLVDTRILSAPSEVLQAFFEKLTSTKPDGATLGTHFWMSFRLALTGFTIAVIIGAPLGLLMGYFHAFSSFMTPIFEILRPIPPIAWIPIIILVLGIGMPAKVFIIFISAFVPVVINSYTGVRQCSEVYKNVAQTFGASRLQIFLKVCVPSALPMVFAGIKLSLSASWSTLVAAELLASTEGLGYMIQMGRLYIRPEIIILGMLVIGCTGAVMSGILNIIERKFVGWRTRS